MYFILSPLTGTYPPENAGQAPSEGAGTTYVANYISITHY